MSSCSPLVMPLMGINAIIWLLIQISLRIQSEKNNTNSTGAKRCHRFDFELFLRVSPTIKGKHTHVNIIALLEAAEDLIICRGTCQNTPASVWVAQTNLSETEDVMYMEEKKKRKQGWCSVDAKPTSS